MEAPDESSSFNSIVDISPLVSSRTRLVNGIIDRAESFRIIMVKGTPACGKTTAMHLIANELLARSSGAMPIHIITGWDERDVCQTGGWNQYLMQKTGIKGRDWPTSSAYLLIDEAQESYWDSELWAAFFKEIIQSNTPGNPCVVLFASYGSAGQGEEGFCEYLHRKIPMTFGPAQVISMRADESLDKSLMGGNDPNGLGLLLDAEEATDVMKKYIDIENSPFLSKDLMDELFLISDGHAGCLTSLMDVLGRAKVSNFYAFVWSSRDAFNLTSVESHIRNWTTIDATISCWNLPLFAKSSSTPRVDYLAT
jgi:hypothetical protein